MNHVVWGLKQMQQNVMTWWQQQAPVDDGKVLFYI